MRYTVSCLCSQLSGSLVTCQLQAALPGFERRCCVNTNYWAMLDLRWLPWDCSATGKKRLPMKQKMTWHKATGWNKCRYLHDVFRIFTYTFSFLFLRFEMLRFLAPKIWLSWFVENHHRVVFEWNIYNPLNSTPTPMLLPWLSQQVWLWAMQRRFKPH